MFLDQESSSFIALHSPPRIHVHPLSPLFTSYCLHHELPRSSLRHETTIFKLFFHAQKIPSSWRARSFLQVSNNFARKAPSSMFWISFNIFFIFLSSTTSTSQLH